MSLFSETERATRPFLSQVVQLEEDDFGEFLSWFTGVRFSPDNPLDPLLMGKLLAARDLARRLMRGILSDRIFHADLVELYTLQLDNPILHLFRSDAWEDGYARVRDIYPLYIHMGRFHPMCHIVGEICPHDAVKNFLKHVGLTLDSLVRSLVHCCPERVAVCQSCGNPFLKAPKHSGQQCCSARCSSRVRKRASRMRKREEKTGGGPN